MAQSIILTSSFYGHTTSRIQIIKRDTKIKAAPAKKIVEDGNFKFKASKNLTQTQHPLKSQNYGNLRNNLEEGGGGVILTTQSLLATVIAISLVFCSAASGKESGGDLFNRACIGCHVGGGNVIQPGATLFAGDLERNGVETEDEIYGITYSGKGRMPGFGEKCTPRGQCTFGPRLMDEEIRLLAQFVKLQAQQGWPKVDQFVE